MENKIRLNKFEGWRRVIKENFPGQLYAAEACMSVIAMLKIEDHERRS